MAAYPPESHNAVTLRKTLPRQGHAHEPKLKSLQLQTPSSSKTTTLPQQFGQLDDDPIKRIQIIASLGQLRHAEGNIRDMQ